MSLHASAPNQPQHSSALVFIRVAVILLLWLCAFLAFLVAPLLALLLAWVVGMGYLAARHSSRKQPDDRPAIHQFGNGNGNGGRS